MTVEVDRARLDAAAAKARLFGTIAQVQERIKPSHLAQDAVDSATQGVATLARKGADAAKARPVATAAVAGTVGLFLARGWIGKLFSRRNETSKADKGLKSKRA